MPPDIMLSIRIMMLFLSEIGLIKKEIKYSDCSASILNTPLYNI